jgi:hypothetical protein
VSERHAFTINNRQVVAGKWGELKGVEIPLDNGIGISMYEELVYIDGERLYNPATNDVLYRTKADIAADKHQHFFSRETGIWVNAWLIQESGDGE